MVQLTTFGSGRAAALHWCVGQLISRWPSMGQGQAAACTMQAAASRAGREDGRGTCRPDGKG